MANKPQVTLTFAGDSQSIEKTFDKVGDGAKKMGDEVGQASKSFDDAADKFDRAEQRATGFRDTITGVQDTMKGVSQIAKGDLSADAFLTLGAGIGDLSSGFSNLLVPALGSAATAMKGLSLAFITSPIGWVVLGIGLIVGAFILLWNKSEAFRNFWKNLWKNIVEFAGDAWEWIKKLPERIGDAFSKIGDFISRPFRTAFNFVSDAWNNTIGRLSWTVPGWVPVIGGATISAPQLPKFHAGVGRVPGAPGTEVLAIVQAGEEISAPSSTSRTVIEFRSSGNDVDEFLIMIIRRIVASLGGDVQAAFGD